MAFQSNRIITSGPARAIITLLTAVAISYVIGFISEKVNFLERFTVAISDIDVTDLYYSYRTEAKRDSNIVIVNIGYKNRAELAEMIRVIAENKPKVLGGHVFFRQEVDTIDEFGTRLLAERIREANGMVLASSVLSKDGTDKVTIERQSPTLRPFVKEGIVNLNIAKDDPQYGTVRSFFPVTEVDGQKNLSFGFLMASLFDSSVLNDLTEDELMIRWYGRGGTGKDAVFKTIDCNEILDGDFEKSDIEGKIVLMGFLGEYVGEYSTENILYTPLNDKMVGRSLADMYGVEVQANVIKMIVDREFIYHSKSADLLFSLVFLLLFILLLFWIQHRFPHQYSIVSKVALILFLDLVIVTTMGLFAWTDGTVKFLISDCLLIMVFLPDAYEFLESNLFSRWKVK